MEAADRALPVVGGRDDEFGGVLVVHPVIAARFLHRREAGRDGGACGRIDAVILHIAGIFVLLQRIGREEGLACHRLVAVIDRDRAAGREMHLPPELRGRGPFDVQVGVVGIQQSGLDEHCERRLRQLAHLVVAAADHDVERRAGRQDLRGDVLALVDRVHLRRRGHRLAVDRQLEADEIGRGIDRRADGRFRIFVIVDVGQREGDDGIDVRRAVIGEDVAHPDRIGAEEQVFARHADVGVPGQHDAARAQHRRTVVGHGGRDERRSNAQKQRPGETRHEIPQNEYALRSYEYFRGLHHGK